MVNSELLQTVADAIEAESGEHYEQAAYAVVQKEYRMQDTEPTACNSAFCIAGHTVLALGWKPVYAKSLGEWHIDYWTDETGRGRTESYLHEVAIRALGLSVRNGDKLFSGNWLPADGLTAAGALRALGNGAELSEVTH